jgi:LCP family protein required for cell wall assembly
VSVVLWWNTLTLATGSGTIGAMRRLILYLLILGVILFYAGSAGAAATPYYGAVSSFVTGATARDRVATSTAPTGGSPAPSATAAATATPISAAAGVSPTVSAASPAPSPTRPGVAAPTTKAGAAPPMKGTVVATLTPRQLAAEVQHIKSAKVPQGRINFLILGSDNDPKFQYYTHPPTQVMIVLSLDTIHNKITMLSISRDLWVHIPGYPYNTLPDGSGGIGWSKIMIASKLDFNSSACTVENDFGIPIDHWIWVGLKGFTNVINTLHGATVDATHPVVDDTYPDDLSGNPNTYRRIYIPPGPQHLNGDDALHFVRSRHGDSSSDFGRSDRQQILIDQLRRTFAGQDSTTLVSLLPQLLQDFGGELKTDATIDLSTATQYLALFQALKNQKPTNVVLSPPYSSSQSAYDSDPDVVRALGYSPVQEDALAPNWPLIDPLIAQLFGGQVQHPSLMPKDYCTLVPGAVTQ